MLFSTFAFRCKEQLPCSSSAAIVLWWKIVGMLNMCFEKLAYSVAEITSFPIL